MANTLAVTEAHWNTLLSLLELPVESAGVVLASIAESPVNLTVTVREVRMVPADEYQVRSARELRIASGGYVPALAEAATLSALPIFFHTHPGGDPTPSDFDQIVDDQLSPLFASRSRSGRYGSFILGGSVEKPEVHLTIHHGASRISIGRVRVVGQRWRFLTTHRGSQPTADEARFDRQIRAFGHDGQLALNDLTAGVIGAGGTGSAVCEQLLRLGVGRLVVADPDHVSLSNLTRIHEARQIDDGRPKAELVSDLAADLGRPGVVEVVQGSVVQKSVARRLRHCDVLFGCTDDNAGRAVLSRLAYWYLMPLLDMGVVISSRAGLVDGIFGRVTTVMPGTACLLCRGRVDAEAIRNEGLAPEERERLAREGYAPGLGDPNPAVVTYTTLVAALAVNEMLARLFGYSGSGPAPSELIVRIHDRRLNGNDVVGREGHFCRTASEWGQADRDPFLGQLWPAE